MLWSAYKSRKYYTAEILNHKISYYTDLFEKLEIDTSDKTAIEIGAGHGIYT